MRPSCIDAFPCAQERKGMGYSFVYVSRNDNYCGDAVLRLRTSLKSVIDGINATGIEAEILVVDWNSCVPLHTHEYLRTSLGYPITFVIVPPETSARVGVTKGVSEVHGFNLGVRAASKDWIIRMDQDLLYGPRVFTYLSERVSNLNPRELWWCSRRESHPVYMGSILPSYKDVPPMHAWFDMHKNPYEFVREHGTQLPIWTMRTYDDGEGAVGMFAMARSTWHRLGGYNEAMTGWGHMEVELSRWVSERFPGEYVWTNLHDKLACEIVHVWHVEHRASSDSVRAMNSEESFPVRTDSDRWGMVDFVSEIRRGTLHVVSESS